MSKCHLVTGGAGFIGSFYVLLARKQGIRVITLDKLTYSGNPENLADLTHDKDHRLVVGDIGNTELVDYLLSEYQPDAVINFAAESHVDRSIAYPDAFVRSNVLATASLLETCKKYYENSRKKDFRFLHVSTDEVFGTLGKTDPPFTEKTCYAPNSPYSASKAASDHFVRAFNETYGFPTLITNCSNNYGPRQFPEKLIPLVISNALAQKPLPIYGTGENIRDWLHVEDHCNAISLVIKNGKIGETYCIGGNSERTNLEVVKTVCAVLDSKKPLAGKRRFDLVTYVKDRPGHDWRYAIDAKKIESELGWKPQWSFEQGIENTVSWYLHHEEWNKRILNGKYQEWVLKNYTNR